MGEYYYDEKWLDEQIVKQLIELGLDPNDKKFILDARYRPLKNITFRGPLGLISVDYYIEKKWFNQSEINEIKSGKFDIGVKKQPERLSVLALCEEIQNEEHDAGIRHNTDTDIIEHIRQKIEGKKSGIISKLRDKLNFNLSKFRKDQQYAKLKLLKLLYNYEKFGEDKINIIGILSRPSLEYVDKSYIGEYSKYGEIITEIKYEIRKEVGDEFAQEVENTVYMLINEWNGILAGITKIVSLPISKDDILNELYRIKQQIKNLSERLTSSLDSIEEYQENLMEAFYLKISQLKQTARLVDIDRITSFIRNSRCTKELLEKAEDKPFTYKELVIEDLDLYMKDNCEELARLVYQKEVPTEEERIFIRSHINSVKRLFDIYNKQRSNGQLLTLTFLISSLQEIVFTFSLVKGKDEFEFKNEFYNARPKTRTLTSVLKRISKSESVEEIYQLIWIAKIERRIHANIGTLKEHLYTLEIGEYVNSLIRHLVTFPKLTAMKELHKFLVSQIIVSEDHTISHYAEEFSKEIENQTGYKCKVNTYRLFSFFDNPIIRNRFTRDTIQNIHDILKQTNSVSGYYSNEVKIFDNKFIFVLGIDREKKIITISRFYPIVSDKQGEAYIKAGLSNFIDRIQ